MKKWTVYYRVASVGKTKSHGCDSRNEVAKFIAAIKKAGGSYRSLKFDGKNASPKLTLALGGEAKRISS
jgi:hypothetical protein